METNNHLDAEIARLMDEDMENRLFTEAYKTFDIKTGVVVIDGKRVEFEQKTLLDEKLKMIVPKDFQSFPPETLFRPEAKPDVMLVNKEGGTIQIIVRHTSLSVANDEEVIAHMNQVQQFLNSMTPSIKWLEGGKKEISGRQVVFFEFLTPMLGADVYNLTYSLELNHQVLTGSFVATDREIKVWKEVFYQMLESIEIIPLGKAEVEKPPHKDFSQHRFEEGYFGIYHGQEYRFFRTGETECRLMSEKEADCEKGFEPKDGVYKKNVNKEEITSAYELKLQVIYRGYTFDIDEKQKSQVKIITRDCDSSIANELQMEIGGFREYTKWVNKTQIEDVIEKRLPVEGFAMLDASVKKE